MRKSLIVCNVAPVILSLLASWAFASATPLVSMDTRTLQDAPIREKTAVLDTTAVSIAAPFRFPSVGAEEHFKRKLLESSGASISFGRDPTALGVNGRIVVPNGYRRFAFR